MGELDTNRNIAHYYGGRINFSISIDEGRLTFLSLMKNIEFVLNLQGDTMMALCNIFEIPVTVHEDNQVLISLMVSVQI